MSFINDEVFDQGLDYADANGTRMEVCSSEPANYGAISGVALGNKTVNTGAPAAGATDGRRVIVPAITDGAVTATGTASHWALHDNSSILVATGALSATQSVTNGNTFTLDAVSITIRDAS